jgi:hypothetical protein
MPKYRYVRDGESYRNFGTELAFVVGGLTWEKLPANDATEETRSWHFVLYSDIEARTIADAVAIGHHRSEAITDLAILVSGFPIQLGTEGARPNEPAEAENEPPGIVVVPAMITYRIDPATTNERDLLQSQLIAASVPAGTDEQSVVVGRGLRWYAAAVREEDIIDKFIKLFVIIDMFTPSHAGLAFVDRATDALLESFPMVDRNRTRLCIQDLWKVRNAIFHEGRADERLTIALQILERVVRALLRRKTMLPDELPMDEVFKPLAEHEYVTNEGGPWGYLPSSGEPKLTSLPMRVRVGNPGNRDGKHYLYAGEAGIQINLAARRT